MKTLTVSILALMLIVFLGNGALFAQRVPQSWSGSWIGTLSDKASGTKRATDTLRHNVASLIASSSEGHGLGAIMGGKWYAFDRNGEKLAWQLLHQAAWENRAVVIVNGTVKGDTIFVKSLRIASQSDMCSLEDRGWPAANAS